MNRPLVTLNRSVALLAILLAADLSGAASAPAWETPDHRIIASQAFEGLPPLLKGKLEPHLTTLLDGVEEPDRTRIESHKIYLQAIRGKKVTTPAAADTALDRFAKQAEEMIKAGQPLKDVAFVMGQASHFIQDLNVPLHTILGETAEEHAAFERHASFMAPPTTPSDGFSLVKKYRCFAQETAKRSNRFVDAALQPKPPQDVVVASWRHAVNDTANLWRSILYRALGSEKSLELYGIGAPNGEKGKGWLC